MVDLSDKTLTPAIAPAEVGGLGDIAEMTDADNPESYRCDDREGCLDAVHDAARRALTGGKE